MILYHGSTIDVREPKLLKIQRNLDFGHGFLYNQRLRSGCQLD